MTTRDKKKPWSMLPKSVSLTRSLGRRFRIARMMAMPVTPLTSLTTSVSFTFICPKAFCMCESTIKAACWFAAGKALPAGAVSAHTLSLAKGALQTMTGTKLAFVMLVVLAVGGTGVCVALVGTGVRGQAHANGQLPEKGEDLREGRLPSNEAAVQVVPQGKLRADRPAREGIQVTLASARQEYRPGEAVDLILTIKNNDKEEFSYLKDKLRELNDFEITGPDGKEVKRVWNPVEFGGQATFVTVKPGEAVTIKDELKHINLSINLSKVPGMAHYLRHMYYLMDAPGTYRLRIKIGDVTSNELAINVLRTDGFGDEVKGLRARVSLAKEKFPAGVPIEVKYVVKNVSKEEQITGCEEAPVSGADHDFLA
jgi:hypothetical protein